MPSVKTVLSRFQTLLTSLLRNTQNVRREVGKLQGAYLTIMCYRKLAYTGLKQLPMAKFVTLLKAWRRKRLIWLTAPSQPSRSYLIGLLNGNWFSLHRRRQLRSRVKKLRGIGCFPKTRLQPYGKLSTVWAGPLGWRSSCCWSPANGLTKWRKCVGRTSTPTTPFGYCRVKLQKRIVRMKFLLLLWR